MILSHCINDSITVSMILSLYHMQVDISRVTTICKLLESLLCGEEEAGKIDWTMEPAKLHPFLCTNFTFCYVWSMGGNLAEKSVIEFDSFVRDLFSDTNDVKVNRLYK